MTALTANTPICVYCAGRRGSPQWSLEHIWPQSLGGGAGPAEFQTRQVCKACNDLCGLFVDAGFTKTFFALADNAAAAEAFVDPRHPTVLPVRYMGFDGEFPTQPGDVCERWLGPAGEHIYHLHKKDDPKWYPIAGGDIRGRKRDPGRIYVYLTSKEVYWVLTALKSIHARFPAAKRRCLTVVDGLKLAPYLLAADEGDFSSVELREIAYIRGRPAGPQRNTMVLAVDATQRFLAKLALGFGHTLLDQTFAGSRYADDLRTCLWRRPGSEGATPDIPGFTSWEGEADGPRKFLGVAGAWTLVFQPVDGQLFLLLSTPAQRIMGIAITRDIARHPPKRSDLGSDGWTYVVQPQRKVCIGPLTFSAFVAHQLGALPQAELAELEALRTPFGALPRKRPLSEASGDADYRRP